MSRKSQPNAELHNPDPLYVTDLIDKAKQRNGLTSQAAVAKMIGVGLSTLKDWKSGAAQIGYPEQYTLERLAGVL